MAIAETFKNKITEKSKKIENAEGVSVDSMEWLLLFLAAGYIDILFILLAIIGFIPFVGQTIYAIVDPIMNIIATGIFWFYLQNKGMGGYWWLAFGGGLAGLVPVVNWFSWIVSVMILYGLVKAEKIPLAGEAIKKAAETASKNKMKILIKNFILLSVISYTLYAGAAMAQFSSPETQPPGGAAGDFYLTWSANSQAPASYKGKLLPTQNSTLTISALPFIYRPGTKTLIAGSNLIFNWYVDDKFSASKSGLGKSSMVLITNTYAGGSKSIRLEIKTSDGAVSISKGMEIPIVRPQVFVRLADPKTGFPYGVALKNLIVGQTSLNFIAQNYFFNATPENLRWQWLIDGKEVGGMGSKPWEASLNLANIGPLFAQIQIIVKNSSNELETAQSMINLEVK